jgi:protein-disulfide isomerase
MGLFKNIRCRGIAVRRVRILAAAALFFIFASVGDSMRMFVPETGTGIAAGQTAPPVDYDAIESFLKAMTANQAIANLTVIREAQPSPIPGLLEIKFTVEMKGQRQYGIVYVSGSKIIVGQMVDLKTRENLTNQHTGPSVPIRYNIKDLDMNGKVPRGHPGGKLVIVEFSDFQCPYCRKASKPIAELLKKYPDDVVLYYKHFPLTDVHPLAYNMAMASECARYQKAESFWSFHDHFFNDPEIRDEAQLRKLVGQWARKDGLDSDRFMNCYDKRERASQVDQDMSDGHKIGVAATPTFLLNGDYVSGVQPLANFERYLKAN